MNTHPGQIDGAWCDVDVHEVISNAALYVTLLLVYHHSPTCRQRERECMVSDS